jgi:hypothetical protein
LLSSSVSPPCPLSRVRKWSTPSSPCSTSRSDARSSLSGERHRRASQCDEKPSLSGERHRKASHSDEKSSLSGERQRKASHGDLKSSLSGERQRKASRSDEKSSLDRERKSSQCEDTSWHKTDHERPKERKISSPAALHSASSKEMSPMVKFLSSSLNRKHGFRILYCKCHTSCQRDKLHCPLGY